MWFKPLLLNVSYGYYINILRVRASGVLLRHLLKPSVVRGRRGADGETVGPSGADGAMCPLSGRSSRQPGAVRGRPANAK